MTVFRYDQKVRVRREAPPEARPGSLAWVVGIIEERKGSYFDRFPPGIIYSIEFEDGCAADVHESNLEESE